MLTLLIDQTKLQDAKIKDVWHTFIATKKTTATFVSRQIGDRWAGKGATKRHQNPPWKAPLITQIYDQKRSEAKLI